jgi:hypothetical protein
VTSRQFRCADLQTLIGQRDGLLGWRSSRRVWLWLCTPARIAVLF